MLYVMAFASVLVGWAFFSVLGGEREREMRQIEDDLEARVRAASKPQPQAAASKPARR